MLSRCRSGRRGWRGIEDALLGFCHLNVGSGGRARQLISAVEFGNRVGFRLGVLNSLQARLASLIIQGWQ